MTNQQAEDAPNLFAVLVESKELSRAVCSFDLSFARLFDEVVVPYEAKVRFFVDGVQLSAEQVTRLKIGQQNAGFRSEVGRLHHMIRDFDRKRAALSDQEYRLRLEAIFHEHSTDVTAQLIKAYEQSGVSQVGDYLAKRPELIDKAAGLFTGAMKLLGSVVVLS